MESDHKERRRPVDRFYARTFAIASVLLLGAATLAIAWPFLAPMAWAAFLAFLLHPLRTRLDRALSGRPNASAGLLTGATIVVLLGPVLALGAALAAQTSDLVRWVDATMGQKANQQYRTMTELPLAEPLLAWLHDDLGIRTAQLKEWFAHGVQQVPELLTALGGRVFLGAIDTALAFVVMVFVLFFLIRDGDGMVATLRELIPMPRRRRARLFEHLAEVTRAVVFGTLITILIQGTLVGVAFWVTGLSTPLVFGVLAAMLALVPFGGTALVWAPATAVLVAQDRWGMALAMLAIGVLSSTIDNVLRPYLIADRAEIGTLAVLVGVLGGAAAFGPIGLVLGPVVLALGIALLRFAHERTPRPDAGDTTRFPG